MATILVVDDDAHIREVVQYALEREGYTVHVAPNGADGLARAQRGDIDLLVLDILMPEMDGLEVCRALRRESQLPVIFLSSKGDEIDRIVGLELGGDDYLAKPFSPRELIARVRAVLRRHHLGNARPREEGTTPPLEVGPVLLDVERHEVSCGGEAVQLTVNEFSVLHALLRRPGRVATRAMLVNEVYSTDHHITERTIDTYVRRIRAKFKPLDHDPIETVFGLGYKGREA
ncbi:MAG: two-component system response regulator CreB [Proteobacteria bacterium]|nr:MAG: two-component system response regulator CreB [Pseudomonadota bacterium]